MNNIVCFYWKGDRWQDSTAVPTADKSFRNHLRRSGPVSDELASKYVNNLYQGIKKYTTIPFNFICFTNENLILNAGIEKRPFKLVTSKGVLPRMYMFSKEAGLHGSQVLSLDIDLIITGSLDNLLEYDGLFCTRKSWTRGEETLIDGDIISFKAGPMNENLFWGPLVQDIEKVEQISGGGRERFWVRHVMQTREVDTWDQICPGQVCSYKHHVLPQKKVPSSVRIISCHGHPRPHQIEDKWRLKYWK